MGNNNRFKLSDMIPNAWFHKLKDITRARNQNIKHTPPRKKKHTQQTSSSSPSPPTSTSSSSSSTSSSSSLSSSTPQQSKTEQPHLLSNQRKSYYFTRDLTPPTAQPPQTHFQDSPRKSSTKQSTDKDDSAKPLTSSECTNKPDLISEECPISPLISSPEIESLPDHDKNLKPKFDSFDTIPNLQLPPIITKTTKKKSVVNSVKCEERNVRGSLSLKSVKEQSISTCREQRTRSSVRRHSVSSPGVRLRSISPRIASRKVQAVGRRRRTLSESFAVVKSSADPQRDFRESMVEMIQENDIKASKDLEDLLTCYLQLNSEEYHELIIEVFKQIWFDFADVGVK